MTISYGTLGSARDEKKWYKKQMSLQGWTDIFFLSCLSSSNRFDKSG